VYGVLLPQSRIIVGIEMPRSCRPRRP